MIKEKQIKIGSLYWFDDRFLVQADEYLPNHSRFGGIYDKDRKTYFTLDRLTIYQSRFRIPLKMSRCIARAIERTKIRRRFWLATQRKLFA